MNKWMRRLALGSVLAFLFWVVRVTQGVYFGMRLVRWFYDIGAKVYDRLKDNSDDSTLVGQPLVERLLAAADDDGPLQVLDVATGTGRLPMTLLAEPAFTGSIVCVDLSYGMLEIAAQKLAIHGDRVTLIHAPAVPLDFQDGAFDGVTSLEALELMPDSWAAIREMARVLRPGGWLAITNRIGPTAWLMPGKTMPTEDVLAFLANVGLTEITSGGRKNYWGMEFYDLIFARKPIVLPTVDNDHSPTL